MILIKKHFAFFTNSIGASPPLRSAARGPGPIAGQRRPKSRTKRMILKAGRPVVCFQQKALPAMRITALGRLQREAD